MQIGYEDNERYNQLKLKLNGRKTYFVEEGFPMLTEENVHPSILDCTYTIKIESCSNFIVENKIINEELLREET